MPPWSPHAGPGAPHGAPGEQSGDTLLRLKPCSFLGYAGVNDHYVDAQRACPGPTVRERHLLIGLKALDSSVGSLIVGSTFTQSPPLWNPAKSKLQRAACSLCGKQRLKLEYLERRFGISVSQYAY